MRGPGHYDAVAALLEPAPCEACGMANLCRRDRLACEPFAEYVHEGRFDRDAPRRPTSATFERLFPIPNTKRRRRRR